MSKSVKKNKISLLKAGHEIANGLYDSGIIDSTTMREFYVLCLPLVKKLSPNKIKKLRLREKVSQVVFSKILNTTASTIRHWEQGNKKPSGTSLKLLNLIHENGIKILI